MRALEGLSEASAFLKGCGIKDSRREAELIISDYLGMGKVALYRDNPLLTASQREKMNGVLERRRYREPLQYIIGFVDFLGLRIQVGPGALIPRPETELVAEEAIRTMTNCEAKGTHENERQKPGADPSFRILDLCTGSGCLALALARRFRNLQIFGTDISPDTLKYAVMNAKINGIINVDFMEGHLYEPVDGLKFRLVVSNPPYIRRSEISDLPPEISLWEPLAALDGGEDGLGFYREILSGACDYLTDNGSLIVELGYGQASAVMNMAESAGLSVVSVVKDYAGIDRVMHLTTS